MEFLIPRLSDILDIIFIAVIIYSIILVIKRIGGYEILAGLGLILIMYFIASVFKLQMVTSILKGLQNYWILVVVIIFQPEIRSVLAKTGQNHYLNPFRRKTPKTTYTTIVNAINAMSFRKIGALIVFEKSRKLTDFIQSGEVIDALISSKLLLTIFNNKTILHDGAVVIRKDRVFAVKVVLPLSQQLDYVQKYGTRHLAAIGVTENTDAFTVVVSEQSGDIAFAKNGVIHTNISTEELLQRLTDESK